MQRSKLTQKALSHWSRSTKAYHGTLAMCTGSGKSRIGILALEKLDHKNANFCIVVPTIKLRDNNWDEEFIKWGKQDLLDKTDKFCYASINKIKGKKYDCVIFDEVHNLTENNSKFIGNNEMNAILGLTATPPEDIEKKNLLDKFCPVVFELSLKEGIDMGIVAPYSIKVIELRLDNKTKNIQAGKKPNYYNVTEKYKYESLGNIIRKMTYAKKDPKWLILQRMRFLYNLPSKLEVAKYILNNIIPIQERTIIFCGSIEQAEELCKDRYHSKTDDSALNKFIKKKINRLSCVEALNEGHNLPDVDSALIVQLNSKKKDLVQRVGRIVRMRDNHRAMIYILSVQDTQDEVWTENALSDFENIEYINYKNIKNEY